MLKFEMNSVLFIVKHVKVILRSHIKYETLSLRLNKLSINVPKTHYMVFSNKYKKANNVNIEIDHKKIEECKSTLFLGG